MTSSTGKGLSVVAENLTVSVADPKNPSVRKMLLKDVSFRIEPGDFICVLGPSGSGKSTLVRAILGERTFGEGRLLVGGHHVLGDAKELRGSIGYLPQRDINPPALPVSRALHYASVVRMPAGSTTNERQALINQAISDVGLNNSRDVMIGNLSGGEAKRASLAAEMLASPGLLVVDEATSGLDPATETRIMKLLAARAEAGTTVITVTHHLGNVDQASKILIMGDGEVVWFGTRIEALVHFSVHRLADIYIAIEDHPAGYWGQRWRELKEQESAGSGDSKRNSADRHEATPPASEGRVALREAGAPGLLSQCSAMFRRDLESLIRDPIGLAGALILPVLLAFALLIAFSTVRFHESMMLTRLLDPGEKEVLADVWGEVREAITTDTVAEQVATVPAQIRVFLDSQPKILEHLREPSTARLIRDALTDVIPLAPDREIIDPSGTFKWLALMSICVVILGFLTGYREIVKERPMLDLERRHGLSFAAYVIAKVLSLAVILLIQIVIFRTLVEVGFMLRENMGGDYPASIYRRGAVLSALFNWLAALACASIGLIASACVRSTDRGVLVVPLLIMPQILLGGAIIPITGGILKVCSLLFSPLYWAYRGCRVEGEGVPPRWQMLGPYDPSPWIPFTGLMSQIVVAVFLTILVLWWQERKAQQGDRVPGPMAT